MHVETTYTDGTVLEQAKELLHLTTQLADAGSAIMVADPEGNILLANTQATQLLFTNNAKHKHLNTALNDTLFENPMAMLAGLPQQKRLTTPFCLPNASPGFITFNYLVFKNQTFIVCTTSVLSTSLSVPFSEENYKDIFENSPESISILDLEGKILDTNKASLQFTECSKQELIGKSLAEILDLNDFEENTFYKRIIRALQGDVQKFDWWFKGANQELVVVEIILKPARYLNQNVIIATANNIYERIHTEQNVRFRNSQLEFVNYLLTHLARFKTTEEILQFTLEQLLEKTHTVGGGIYLYHPQDHQINLLSACGVNQQTLQKHPSIPLSDAVYNLLTQKDIRKSVKILYREIEQTLQTPNQVIMPLVSDQAFVGLFVLYLPDAKKITTSFIKLIDSIGAGIGQYITKYELNRQLSASESKYLALFDSSSDAIILSDNLLISDCNRAAQIITGLTKDAILEHTLPSLLGHGKKEEEAHLEKLLSETVQFGQQVTFEWKRTQEQLPLLETEISFNRILIDGKFYIQTIIRDITQQRQIQASKRKEEVLTESINQFRDFISKVEMAYLSLDQDGNIKYLNNYFQQLLGYKQNELIGKNYFDLFIPAEERQNRRELFRNMIDERTLVNHFEREIKSKEGEVKTLFWQRMFEYDAEGNIIGITSLGKDVTDKKAAMEALKDNRSRLQDIFDNAHDLIQNISVDNKFIFVNKAWKEKLGYDDYDIEKLSLNDIVHPYYKAKLIYQLRNLYKGENVNKIETVFLTKLGKPVHLIGSINCTMQNGKPVATRAILHDITDRIKAERLQKVYYSIANLAISSKDLNSLYGAIHRELSKIIETNNIFIALCNEEKTLLNFVYHIDQHIQFSSSENEKPFTNGLSEYIINTGKPLYLLKEDVLELEQEGVVTMQGVVPEVILCSPLSVGDRIIGVIAVQDYRKQDAYVNTDIEILHFISNQVALAIERKRNEVQINNQNARLKAIFESGSHLMWSINRQRQFTAFNQNFANDYLNKIGVFPQVNNRIMAPAKIDSNAEELEIWSKNYELAFNDQPRHFEIRDVDAQHHEQWQEVFLNPIYLEDGSFEEISAMAVNITEKKLSQLALAENEEKFRSIFESFQDLYYRIDTNGIVTLMSPSVLEVLGFLPEEVIGLHATSFYVNQEDRVRMLELLNQHHKIRNFDVQLRGKDNTVKDVLLNSNYIYDKDGKNIGIEGVARDFTQLKQIQLELIRAKEVAESSLQAKTQFLANMSHELRTPMNGIIGMIDLLYHTISSEEQREYVDTLRKSSDALLTILNDILDLSKIQAGKLMLNESGVDLYYSLDKIHSLFINRANQKDLTFTYDITAHTPRFIITDETRLLQVLSNLTSNAIKFTNSGSIHIQVNSISAEDNYQTIMFQVNDSGIGITDTDKTILFTNFTQLDNSSTKSFGGTGLGLAISKQLSELLGGEIGVDSIYGEGSTFWFTIKCRVAENEAEILENQLNREDETELPNFDRAPQVLLVDDNAINQKVAQKLLLHLGCETDTASNGFEAIELACSRQYDLIFMDIQMPEMDGVTATGEIKKILQANCPPIVAMTAYSMKDDAEKFLSQGLDDYVSKPVKANHLRTVIKRWFTHDKFKNIDIAEDAIENSDIFIDEKIIEQLRQLGGNDFAKQLYEEFEEETAPLLEEAATEVYAKHYGQILSTLHQIKGTGFTLGLNPIAEMAKKLEYDIHQQDFTHVDENFELLMNHFNTFKNVYPIKFT